MSKPPSFQFYPKDWLTDQKLRSCTYQEKGLYMDLLSLSWLDQLPQDEALLASSCGLHHKQLPLLRRVLGLFFEARNGYYVNSRMETERKKQDENRKKKRYAGYKSGEARRTPVEQEEQAPVEHPLNPSSSFASSSSSSNSFSKEIYKEIFDYWQKMPELKKHRSFKGTMRERIIRAINGRLDEDNTQEDIMRAIQNYNDALADPGNFYTYKWTLEIFLTRSNGFPVFVDGIPGKKESKIDPEYPPDRYPWLYKDRNPDGLDKIQWIKDNPEWLEAQKCKE